MNALDNVDARRHVNRLCLAAGKVLVEAGTTGFDGQTFVIAKGQTACYECQPKPTQKVYPICTIRSTPDKPVHCVVWAKELFKLLFGLPAESLLDEPLDGPDESVYMAQVSAHPAPKGEAASVAAVARYAEAVISALFSAEVSKQLSMDKYKTARFVPVPVPPADIAAAVARALPVSSSSTTTAAAAAPPPPPPPPSAAGPGWDRKVWTQAECVAELASCIHEYWSDAGRSKLVGSYAFDKDDKCAMRFVAAAANLRGSVFKIESLTFHDVKGVAGNIVPAIATTNAIVAGQQVPCYTPRGS
jgi:ubiquitin-like 1-activating enzyme E1 B